MVELILASSSPRRQDMLKELGLTFKISPPNIDETPQKGEHPQKYVERIAYEKAKCAASNNPQKVILAADTAGALGRKILGKPKNTDEARNMIKSMAGRRHKIISTVCVIDQSGVTHSKSITTICKMKPLTPNEIESYVQNENNWKGKSGGYGLQTSAGGALIQTIYGSHTSVIGLPLVETIHLLRRCGVEL